MRSMFRFTRVLKETPDGWHLKCRYEESFGKDEIAMALDMMIRSMQAGYGSALLLMSWKFQDGPDGIVCEKTSLDFGKWIWEKILHSPVDLPSPDIPGFAYQA